MKPDKLPDFQQFYIQYADECFEFEGRRKRLQSIRWRGYAILAILIAANILAVNLISGIQILYILVPGILLTGIFVMLGLVAVNEHRASLKAYYKENILANLIQLSSSRLLVQFKGDEETFEDPPRGLFLNQQELQFHEGGRPPAKIIFTTDDHIVGKGQAIRFRLIDGTIDIAMDYNITKGFAASNHRFQGILISFYHLPKGFNFEYHLKQGAFKESFQELIRFLEGNVQILRDLDNHWHLKIPKKKPYLEYYVHEKLTQESVIKRIYLEYALFLRLAETIDDFIVQQK